MASISWPPTDSVQWSVFVWLSISQNIIIGLKIQNLRTTFRLSAQLICSLFSVSKWHMTQNISVSLSYTGLEHFLQMLRSFLFQSIVFFLSPLKVNLSLASCFHLKKFRLNLFGISNFDHYCVAKIIVRQEKNRSHEAQMLSAKGSAKMEVIFHLQFLVYFSADSSSTGPR